MLRLSENFINVAENPSAVFFNRKSSRLLCPFISFAHLSSIWLKAFLFKSYPFFRNALFVIGFILTQFPFPSEGPHAV